MKIYNFLGILLAASALLLVQYGHAAVTFPITKKTYMSADPCGGEYDARVLFINGIWNTFEKARDSRDELQKRFNVHPPAQSLRCIEFDLGYNHAEKPWDLWGLGEAIGQWRSENTKLFWSGIAGLITPEDTEYSLVENFLELAFLAAIDRAQSAHDEKRYLDDDSLQNIVDMVREYNTTGKPTLIVGHSQGGYYANEAYRLTFSDFTPIEDLLSLIVVATPVTGVEGPPWHVTSNGDKHVTLEGDIILAVPGSLPANTDNGVLKNPIGIHKFIDSYMAGQTSRGKILDLMVDYLEEMIPPSTAFSIGDNVEVKQAASPYVNIRDAANGNKLGTQTPDSQGTVVGGSVWAGGSWWWQIDFNSGADGWVAEPFIQKVEDGNQVIYRNVFSTDPNWTTDQPENFYWDSETETFVARTENVVPEYIPNRYAFEEINLDVTKSFSIRWDQKILERNGYGISNFGLFADDFITSSVTYNLLPWIIPKSTLNAGLGGNGSSQSFFYGFNIYTGDRYGDGQGGSGAAPPDGSLGIWFSNSLTFDATTAIATWEQKNRETDEVILRISRTVTGVFAEEMTNLGVAHHPIGYHPALVWSLDPTDYQITAYDNIVVIGKSK